MFLESLHLVLINLALNNNKTSHLFSKMDDKMLSML